MLDFPRPAEGPAMKLIGLLDSPFVRRVAISLQVLGLRFEHEPVSVFRGYAAFEPINPVVRAPTLVCDDGEVLMDSTLILEYAQALTRNNGSEIAVREGVIKRKISYGTRSESGKAAWENQLTILDTCRKQGVSYFEYILDIISGSYSMPRLSQLLMRSKSSTAY